MVYIDFIDVPLISISPSDGSYNLRSNFRIVDFPDPGPPIKATLAPEGIEKETFFRTFFSVPGYAKVTLLKDITFSHSPS